MTNDSIYQEVSNYYTKKINSYGPTPSGVDWNGKESQDLRFHELLKCLVPNQTITINDLGCGYGALVNFLSHSNTNYKYYGYDISEKMIEQARNINSDNACAHFYHGSTPLMKQDYSVASGIFNVKQSRSDDEWLEFIINNLWILHKSSEKSFAFNCLTSYSDLEKKKSYLYYANPCFLFDYCKKKFSKNVILAHDYGLYEFTIIVKK